MPVVANRPVIARENSIDINLDHTSHEVQERFLDAHRAWQIGHLDALIDLMHDDILYIVNVDGQQVPYAMSAVGAQDLRDRLQLLLHVFDVTTFEIERLIPEPEYITSLVHGIYRHKATWEVLDVRVRFRAWASPGGKFVRFEEIHDARYIEAFERFVFHLESASKTI